MPSSLSDRVVRTLLLLGAASLPACSCAHAPADTTTQAPLAAPAEDPESPALPGQEGEDPPEPVNGAAPPPGSAGAALLAEVDREVQKKTASKYSHHTHVDEASGTFEYDCSGFLRYALSRSVPDALATAQSTAKRPLRSSEFVAFLEGIAPGAQQGRWQRVGRVQDLLPGDVIVWLKPADSQSTNTGHTMIVHGNPSPDPAQPGSFFVPIADSTENPHRPGDARAQSHDTGLGYGEIELIADGTGAPVRYRWSRGAKSREKPTTIMLGRLR